MMGVDPDSQRGTKRKLNQDDLPAEAPRRIRALDQDVVNKIAAGETIVAPVHALKELTENAVDAGSTSLEILVKDGGLKLLQITDNGHGINRDDLPILCERFTTSKLKAFEDLGSIETYGFRGEALASISHIAHLQVTTKVKESSCAWRAHYADGKLVPQKPGQNPDPKACAGRQGTQITVEDLFYNVPTRRRAFRSASEEYSKVLDMVGRYAIHCSGVAFSCKKHGDAAMGISVASNATTIDRIRQIHGSGVANELIQFRASDDRWGFKSEGWISNANYHVKKTTLLLFINHRAVESSAIKKAVEQTYVVFLPKGGHPFVYVSLEIDPHRVDVNVHPTKREVKFLNEDEIIELMCEEIRSQLGKVDTSRTFMTQTLLPGVNVPTISIDSISSPSNRPAGDTFPTSNSKPSGLSMQMPQSAIRPYENNLVRTDSRARKITTMFQPTTQTTTTPQSIFSNSTLESTAEANSLEIVEDETPRPDQDGLSYARIDREPMSCRLSSVKELRTAVRDSSHANLTDIIASYTFVGVVDHARRLAAIQSRTKLLLVDYGFVSFEFFYQLGLTDFGNFGSMKLDQPLSLLELLRVGAKAEAAKEASEKAHGDDDDFDWEEVVQAVADQIMLRRDMIAEYFRLQVNEDGDLTSLPLMLKGYTPSMAKLPTFLLRLGPHVQWDDEKACFKTFLKELASWYTPEGLPPPSHQVTSVGDDSGDSLHQGGNDAVDVDEDPISKRREELDRCLEHVLFPAFQARLVATRNMLSGVVEVANLKGLYRVFERC